MSTGFPYMKLIKVFEINRKRLIEDTVLEKSPELYDMLYSGIHSEIHSIKMELYELQWLERHWTMIENIIKEISGSPQEKEEWFAQIAEIYKQFMSEWSITEFDAPFLEKRIGNLEELIAMNSHWENALEKIRISFIRDRKAMRAKIEKLKKIDTSST